MGARVHGCVRVRMHACEVPVKSCGNCKGIMMASLRICFASCSPATSSNLSWPLVRIVSSMAIRRQTCLATTSTQICAVLHQALT